MTRKDHLALILTTLLLAGPSVLHGADTARQKEVAKRGARVMPFDLERTVHLFRSLKDGGLERVTVKDPKDRAQIALIRTHLKDEAERFSHGDFSDPARIHNGDMPGLAELFDGAARIKIRYAELPDGAEILFTTDDPTLVDAVHRWFEAQRSDHGEHAAPYSHW